MELNEDDFIFLDDQELQDSVREAISNFGTDKAISMDMVSDYAFSKETLLNLIQRGRSLTFNEPLPKNVRKAKAMILSKIGSLNAPVEITRFIVINSLALRNFYRTCYQVMRDKR